MFLTNSVSLTRAVGHLLSLSAPLYPPKFKSFNKLLRYNSRYKSYVFKNLITSLTFCSKVFLDLLHHLFIPLPSSSSRLKTAPAIQVHISETEERTYGKTWEKKKKKNQQSPLRPNRPTLSTLWRYVVRTPHNLAPRFHI